jgi:hypothetical protein
VAQMRRNTGPAVMPAASRHRARAHTTGRTRGRAVPPARRAMALQRAGKGASRSS